VAAVSQGGASMRWENVKSLFGWTPASICEVKEIAPRPLSAREEGWMREILQVNDQWRNADITKTKVIAQGPNAEGFSIVLEAPAPENPELESQRESVGQIWVQTDVYKRHKSLGIALYRLGDTSTCTGSLVHH
jgi:hypothetical protein